MAASDRKRLLAALVVLVAAVLIAAVMIVRAPDDSSGVEAQTTTRAATAPSDSPSQVAVDEVRLELLRPAVNTSPEVGRNPFRFEARAEQGAGPVVGGTGARDPALPAWAAPRAADCPPVYRNSGGAGLDGTCSHPE